MSRTRKVTTSGCTRRRLVAAAAALAAAPFTSRAQSRWVPLSPFGRESTAEEVTAGLNLAGKTAVVTGCNSGIGYETMHFVVNHLGHFILVNRLLPRVLAAPQGRVVVVGSNNHKEAPEGGIQFDRLSGEGWRNYYHHSKLANGLFSLELAARLAGTRATSNCATPGPVRGTAILRNISSSSANYPKSPAQGAATQCYVATHPSLADVSGEYFADCNPAEQSEAQRDTEMAARLWAVSEALTRGYI